MVYRCSRIIFPLGVMLQLRGNGHSRLTTRIVSLCLIAEAYALKEKRPTCNFGGGGGRKTKLQSGIWRAQETSP